MTALLVALTGLLLVLLTAQVRETRRLKRLVLELSDRLDRQNELLSRLVREPRRRPSDPPPRNQATPVASASTEPISSSPKQAPAGPVSSKPPRPTPPAAKPARPPLQAAWRYLRRDDHPRVAAALLTLFGGTGAMLRFSLTLGWFSPVLRLGAAFVVGLIFLAIGLLAPDKRRGLALAAESCGLGLMFLSLAGAAKVHSLLGQGPAQAALAALGVFAALTALKQNSPTLTVLTPLTSLGLLAAVSRSWGDLALASAGAGLLYLALLPLINRTQPAPAAHRLIRWQALACFNLALAARLFEAPPPGLETWTILSLVWALEGASLYLYGCRRNRPAGRRAGAVGLALAALAAGGITDRLAGAPVTQFFLAAVILGWALLLAAWARLTGSGDLRPPAAARSRLPALGLLCWLAGSLASIWGFVAAYAEPDFILNWLLVTWSFLGLGLRLTLKAAPALLTQERPGLPVLVLIQATALCPALILALGYLGAFLRPGAAGPAGGLNLPAWLLMAAAQALGLAQARKYGPVTAWSNAWLLTLALGLGQLASALIHQAGGAAFLKDLGRLAALLAVLALLTRPPRRLSILSEPGLFRAAGVALSALVMGRFLSLTLDPADRPGFFGFLPILNLTDLAQAAAFILPGLFLRRRAPELARGPAADFLWPALFFIWFNVALARSVHHLGGVPYQFEALLRSDLCQAVWAVAWAAAGLGAMIVGHKTGRRSVWLFGAALAAADLAKIFFLDLAQAGAAGRLAALAGLGAALALAGYIAKPPPAPGLGATFPPPTL